MLELPESHVFSAQLNKVLAGRTVVSCLANSTPHGFAFYAGDPALYPLMLAGKKVHSVSPSGGLIEFDLGELALTLGDGVTPKYFAPNEKPPVKHQLLLTFDDGASLACTIQMYGGMYAFVKDTYDNFYYRVTKEKPSPLSEAFDRAYFDGLISEVKKNLSLKAFLATEQRIPGLGNGVLQDILFNAGLSPKTKLNTLNDAQKDNLYKSVKQTLTAMTAEGGRDTEKDVFGSVGGYKTILSKNTWHYQCPRCGGSIVREAYMGGNEYYCTTCQR
jgi:formamidopyrimidine-DNA glycosylase